MKVRVLWVGKTKEPYAREGIEKYLGLLRPLAEIEIVEIKEQRGRPVEESLRREGEDIRGKSPSYVLLDERGREMTSIEFASMIKRFHKIDFVLGGPYGVSEEARTGASRVMALSRMTLPHEMARVVFLEQLYRAMTINRGRGYHH